MLLAEFCRKSIFERFFMKTKHFWLFLSAFLLLNITGLFGALFMGDSALYACISKSFVSSHNWWDIYVNGQDWLDKPHFPFWLCALSMQLFGVNTFAYKLPSVLLFFLALYYTYRLSSLFYNRKVARLAVLILASSVHIVVSNNDVRAEAMLLPLIIGAVYHLFLLNQKFSWRNLLLAALLSAFAVMTKGIFVLIIIYSAVLCHLWFMKKLHELRLWKWILFSLLVLLFISPELYALYAQFDLHPEKTVFGQTHVSGLRFFFWESQFGRFVNSGPIRGHGDPFFFLHTLLWAFAPWAIVAFMALGNNMRKLLRGKKISEYITLYGFLVMFVIFSISRFQLPHYTNILFPFLAILCAKYIVAQSKDRWFVKTLAVSQWIYAGIYLLVLGLIIYFFRAENWLLTVLLLMATAVAVFYMYRNFKSGAYRSIYVSMLFTLLFLLYLNWVFYPSLLQYQSASNASKFANTYCAQQTVVNQAKDPLLDFGLKAKVLYMGDSLSNLQASDHKGKLLYYANQQFVDTLQAMGVPYHEVKRLDGFRVTKLKREFFYYKSRTQSLSPMYLIELVEPHSPIALSSINIIHKVK